MKAKKGKAQQPKNEGGNSTLQVVVETPKGSRNKCKLNPKTSRIMLSKVLPEGMMFPYDFGFVPDTRAEDGDPLDILLLTDEPDLPRLRTGSAGHWCHEGRANGEGQDKQK